jgi:hypothetical protein
MLREFSNSTFARKHGVHPGDQPGRAVRLCLPLHPFASFGGVSVELNRNKKTINVSLDRRVSRYALAALRAGKCVHR